MALSQDVIVKETPNFSYPEKDMKYTTAKQILTKVGYAVSDYQIYAVLLGSSGQVDQPAINKFNALFESNTEILDDLATYPRMVAYQDYTSTVYNYLKNDGVHFNIRDNEAYAMEITKDDLEEEYYVKVQFVKVVYTLLNNSFKKSTCKSGREIRMVLTYNLPFDAIDDDAIKPKIATCSGEVLKDCSDAGLSITPSVRYGYGLLNIGDPTGFGASIPSAPGFSSAGYLTPEAGTKSASLISVGAKINYAPFKDNKNMSLSGGLFVGFYNLTHTFSGDFVKEDQTDKDVSALLSNYDRIIRLRGENGNSGAKEKISAMALEVPLGLSYKIFKNGNKTLTLVGDFHLIPIFTFSGNAQIDGRVSYQGWYTNEDMGTAEEEKFWVLLSDIPSWDYRTNEIVNQKNKINSNFSFAVSISPAVQYVLNEESGLGIEFGIDYRLGLTNLLKSDTSHGDVLLGDSPEDMRGSVLENYYESSKLHSIGARLGLILEL